MAFVNNSTVLIKNLDKEAYNLGSVTANPRSASAVDIKAALDNLVIESPEGTNDVVLAVIEYLFYDFFPYAHQSGLYNRQIRLWEMFSRISTVEIKQFATGIFTHTPLPVYHLLMKTNLGQSPVCALVIGPETASFERYKNWVATPGKIYLDLLHEFLTNVTKVQARQGVNGIKGIFVVTPEPLEPALLSHIEKETRANDPVSKVESILPAPYSAHINLLTYGAPGTDEAGTSAKPVITLAYPNISRKAAAHNAR